MLKLLPYDKFDLHTMFPPQEIMDRLNNCTLTLQEYLSESDKRIFGSGGRTWSKPYWGYIQENQFELQRLINYRGSAPKIFGAVKQTTEGTFIRIVMRPRGSDLLLPVLACLVFLYAFAVSSLQAIRDNALNEGVVAGAGLAIAVYLFILLPYRFEAVKARRFIIDLLEAKNNEGRIPLTERL